MFVLKVYPLCSYSLSCSLSLSMHIVIWQLEKWKYRCRVICQRSDRIPVVKQRIIARFPWYQINEINSGLDILSQCKLFYIKKFQATYFQSWNHCGIKVQNHSAPAVFLRYLIITYTKENIYIYINLYTHTYIHTYTHLYVHRYAYKRKVKKLKTVLSREVNNAFVTVIQRNILLIITLGNINIFHICWYKSFRNFNKNI